MILIERDTSSGIGTIAISNGKVNAIRMDLVETLASALDELERDDAVSIVILTADGPFFSFGFDVPHFLGQDRADFGRFLHAFTDLYTRVFLYSKPVVAAINGHAVAGGWMLAQPCDARVLVRGNIKVGLNEVRFGAALFAGSLEILRHLAGGRIADRVAGSGAFFLAEEALALGLVNDLCDRGELLDSANALAENRYGSSSQPSFAAIRQLVRGPIVEAYRDREGPSIERFMDIWYTPAVQESLGKIAIRG